MLLILALAAAGIGYLYYKKMNVREEADDTGGMASLTEAGEAYGYDYGRGGYLLGRYIDKNPGKLERILPINTNKIKKSDSPTLWVKLEDRFRMLKIQASIGSGKTTQFIVPQLIEDAVSGIFNIYVIDRKPPELAAMTAGIYEHFGHRVIHFNPWIQEICCGFEPVFGATTDEIEAMVEVLIPMSQVEDSTWLYRVTDRDIVRTVFRAVQIAGVQDRSLATLPGIAKLFKNGVMATREVIESTRDKNLINEIKGIWGYNPSELEKMFRGLAGRFSVFVDDEMVAKAFSRSDFTMKDIVIPPDVHPSKRTILYVGASQSKGDRSRKIASLLTRLLTIEAFRRGDEMRVRTQTWKDVVPLVMYLDERGTYHLPEEDEAIATFRALGVAVVSAYQSDKQLVKFQGKEAAETSETNFNFDVVLGGCDLDYAKKISEEIGTHWVWVRSETKSRSYESMEWGRKKTEGEGWRKVEEPIMKPNQIMGMPDDEALIIGRKTVSTERNCPPVRVKLYAFYKTDEMSRAVSQSEKMFTAKCRENFRADSLKVKRRTNEVEKLPEPVFDWENYLRHN